MEGIGLHELISQVKEELLMPYSDDFPLLFIGEVKLEIAITVSKAVDGKIDLKVVATGGSQASEEVQRITVTLHPLVTVDEQRSGWSSQTKARIKHSLRRGGDDNL